MNNIIFDFSIGVAFTIGITEAIKRMVNLKNKYIPAVSLIAGVFVAFISMGFSWYNILTGIAIGLSSCGLS